MPESALYRHSSSLYEFLLSESKSDNGKKLWKGGITQVYRDLGIPMAKYSDVRIFLEESGCMTMTVRGARNVPTEIILHREPTLDEAENWGLTRATEAAIVSLTDQRVTEILENIGGINIKEAFKNLEDRVKKLEGKSRSKEGK